MAGGERAMVSGVHRCEHVECLWSPHLAEHESIWPHAQGAAQQGGHAHLECAVVGRWSSLESQHMLGLQSQFSHVFYGDDAFARVDMTTQRIQQRGLAARCRTGHHHIAAFAHNFA